MSSTIFLQHAKTSDLSQKNILLRLDMDVPKKNLHFDMERTFASKETIDYLLAHNVSRIGIIGHLGRPKGNIVPQLTLKPIFDELMKTLDSSKRKMFHFHENLRFHIGEEKNDDAFAKHVCNGYDTYVFDAFAVSHRLHASVVGIPTLLPTYIGMNVQKEVTELTTLFKPSRPYLAIIGGSKPETKIELIGSLSKIADTVLVGGSLAKKEYNDLYKHFPNVVKAQLRPDEYDISPEDTEKFCEYITKAKTIVWNGPLGMVEKKEYAVGTKKIVDAIQLASAHTILGGGDTISFYRGLNEKRNAHTYICMGGGAMLYFLTHHNLPIFDAVKTT